MQFIGIFIFFNLFSSPYDGWTEEQWRKASTADAINHLTAEEKQIFTYVNLARMYPADFAEKYIAAEKNKSSYHKSLYKTLKTMQPVGLYYYDEEMYQFAKCFAKEMGKWGIVGHTRKKCPKGNFAECCAYGSDTGKEIVLQLLIDQGVPGLGHRVTLLSPNFTKMGASIQKHKTYRTGATLDII
jgi:uncharacterized protein YkwD